MALPLQEVQEGSLFTPASLQEISPRRDLLEACICQQHKELKACVEEVTQQQNKLLNSHHESICKQIEILNWHLQSQTDEMKHLTNLMSLSPVQSQLEQKPDNLHGACEKVSFASPRSLNDTCVIDFDNQDALPDAKASSLPRPADSTDAPASSPRSVDSMADASTFKAVEVTGPCVSRKNCLVSQMKDQPADHHATATEAGKECASVPVKTLTLQMHQDSEKSLESEKNVAENGGVNEYGLSRTLEVAGVSQSITGGPSHSVTRGYLSADLTNLRFAHDLLKPQPSRKSFANAGLSELQAAMDQWELPAHTGLKRRGIGSTEPERTSCLARVLQSPYFEYFVCAIIFANTCFITYATDYAIAHPYDQGTPVIAIIQAVFQVYYVLEMIAKLQVHRLYLFTNKDWLWNILDLALVMASLYDFAMSLLEGSKEDGSAGNGFSLTFLRMLRMVRILKVMRLFRVVRFFSELNVLLKVVTSSLRPLFWCTFMLMLFIYLFAVIFTHGAASYLARDGVTLNSKATLLDFFGSVTTSMLSLSKASTGGQEWGPQSDVLLEVGKVYYCLYLFYVGFTHLALMNILTGLFVDRTFKAVADDHDGLALEKLANDRSLVTDLCRIYCSMTGSSVEDDRTISKETFKSLMNSPVLRARLAVLDLEVWDSARFFQMLTSISHTQDLDLVSWVVGCMQLRGQANRLSVQAIHADLHKLTSMSYPSKSMKSVGSRYRYARV